METDCNKVNAVVKANLFFWEAAKFKAVPMRMIKIRQAQSVCPEHCPLSYILLFEMEAVHLSDEGDIEKGITVERALRDAVSAGHELVPLLKANTFVKGQLYSFKPTRNYNK